MFLSWDAAPDLSFSYQAVFFVFISLEEYNFTKENVIHAHLPIASKSGLMQCLLKKRVIRCL